MFAVAAIVDDTMLIINVPAGVRLESIDGEPSVVGPVSLSILFALLLFTVENLYEGESFLR